MVLRSLTAIVVILIFTSTASAQERGRTPLLLSLYASHATLQGLDVHSTHRALQNGGYEANPILKGLTTPQMAGVKVATGSVVIFLTDKMRKKSPAAAYVVMFTANAAMSAVVANNYRIGAK